MVIALNAGWQLYTHVLSPQSDSLLKADPKKMAPFPVDVDKPTIAVLPFNNMSGDPGQEFFVDGVTENITTELSKNPRLSVKARNSAFVYKGKPINVKKVAEDLGVRYVLEGSVQKSGGRIRITGQLIDTASGNHIWSEKYDRDMKDFFALIDDVTHQIGVALQMKLADGQNWSEEQKEILKLAVQLFELFLAKNLSDIMKLYHEDYLGWGAGDPKPIGKMELESGWKSMFENFPITSYELKPMAIKIFKDIAIIYTRYTVVVGMDGNNYTGRMGKFCVKQGGKWQIIADYNGGSSVDDNGIQDVEQAWSKEQKELLEIALQGWKLFQEKNLSGMMKLSHEDYLGWPNWSPKPFEYDECKKVCF